MTLSRDAINGLPYVEGVLSYLAPMAERPINLTYDPPPGVPRSTGVPEAHRMTIYNVRPVAARLSLDSEGLALVTHNSAVRDFYDEDELRRIYYPEAERLVAEVTGAARVLVFDHTVRRRVWDGVDRSTATPRQPVDHGKGAGFRSEIHDRGRPGTDTCRIEPGRCCREPERKTHTQISPSSEVRGRCD